VEFIQITAFRLVLRLTMGRGATAMYLLVHTEENRAAIEEDLNAELEVQLGAAPSIKRTSPMPDRNGDFGLYDGGSIRILQIDRWIPELLTLLDTHVVRLERSGAQFLFLATPAMAEKLLVEAPNFRNRITEVLRIVPDDFSGGMTL
jgi:hypothetical protein